MTHHSRKSGQFSRLRGVAVLAALALTGSAVVPPTAAQAQPAGATNAVVIWNIHAQTAIYEVARQSPTTTTRSFAMVQGAVYDAVNAIAGAQYEPYLVARSAAGSGSARPRPRP